MPNRSPQPAAKTRKRLRAKAVPERAHWIAEAAYFLSERRGFAPGGELCDWLEAERAFETRTTQTTRPRTRRKPPPPAGDPDS